MTTLNNKLLTIFLVLGTIFFVAILYTFVTKELLMETVNHKISFDGVTFMKNGYADLTMVENEEVYEDEHCGKKLTNKNAPSCYVDLINLTDNLSYAKTNAFMIKTIRKTPQKIFATGLNETTLPSTSLKDKYKLKISCDNKIIEEFSLGEIDEILNLNKKKNTVTEKKDIKLISKDKKLIIFVNFTID